MPAYNKHRYFAEITPRYDWIIGNPPFGGTIAPDIQDNLDDLYGFRHGRKIKKETYAFFINLFYCFIYGTILSAILSRNIPPRNPFAGEGFNRQ